MRDYIKRVIIGKHEKGYQAMKEDRGNYVDGKLIGTKFGISAPVLKRYLGRTPTVRDMKELKLESALDILENQYYKGPKIDKLPLSVRKNVLDMAINAGPGRAIKILQKLIGAKQDGAIGPETLKKIKESKITNNDYVDSRRDFYLGLVEKKPVYKKFKRGWLNRVESFRIKEPIKPVEKAIRVEEELDLEGPKGDRDPGLTEEILKIKEEAKEEIVRDPYYGTEVDMPKPEISPEQMPLDPPTPYGVYAQDQPEFEEAEKVQMWAADGGEVEYKDSWREEEVEEIPEYLQRPEDRVEEPLIPNVPEVPGFVPVEPPPVEPKPKPELNLIEESKKTVEEFQRPDDEMVKKSYYEIESSLQDIDPKTKRLNPEAKQFLSQLEPKAIEEYRETYASGPERTRLNEVLVKQKDDRRKGVSVDITEDDLIKIKTPRKLSELEIRKRQADKDRKELIKAEDEAIDVAMKLSSVDPKRFYKKQSTFDKVVSLIGLAAGAYGAHKYGGPNIYMAELDKEVAKDIKAQQLDQNVEKQKLAAHNFKVATLAKRLARSTKDEDKKANLMKMFLQYQQKGFKASKSMVKDKSKFDLLKASNTRGLTDAEVAMADTLGLKFSDLMIRGRDGLNYKVKGGIARANKVKGYVANAQQTIDGLRDLMVYVDKVQWYKQGGLNPLGRLFSSDVAEADALRDRLVGNLRIEFFGPGVMTDQERAQAKIILGDPTKLLTTDVREKNKIRNLMMKINYGVRQKLRADGLSFKLSPNESRVEQLLGLKKLSNVPFNRRRIIDGLVKAELKAVEAGAKPGTLWDMNEPLPV